MLIQLYGRGETSALSVSVASAFVLILGSALTLPGRVAIHSFVIAITGTFSLIVVVGLINPGTPAIRVLGILAFLALGLILARSRNYHVVERVITLFSILFVFVLVAVLIDDNRVWDRLAGWLHPNLWGFIAGCTIVGIYFSRIHVIVRTVGIAFVLYLLGVEFQTRGAFLFATAVIALFGGVYSLRWALSGRRPYLKLVILGLSALPIIAGATLFLPWIQNDILQINSATRGLSSGLTGRTDLWAHVLSVAIEKPFFGHGLDSSRQFIMNYTNEELVSTHNTYLTILFEFGVIGLGLYLTLIILAIKGAARSENKVLLAYLLVYLLMGLTESRPLNFGNPASILFLLALPYCASLAFEKNVR